jgi:D-amino peptidase
MSFGRFSLCLSLAWAASAQANKSIFVITDAEGVAGVCRQEQTDMKDPEMRQLLTGEINAAVDGFFAGGAEEVVVWDAHSGGASLSILTLHPRAKLLTGDPGVTMLMDRKYAGLAFIGQHSRANVQRGVMAHSYSSLGIQNLLLNGKPVGEIATRAALAGWFGVPVILLTGDDAAVEEIREIVPDAEAISVKEGLGRHTCISLSAQAARQAIRSAATRSMQKIGKVRPYRIEGPVTIEVENTTRGSLPADARLRPGAEVVDDRTIRYRGKDFMEAWIRWTAR